jgi:hypothetical protein
LVSKRRDCPYRAGRSRHWIKVKNPSSPAMKRAGEALDAAREDHLREMRASGVRGIQAGKAPGTMLLRIGCLTRLNFAGLRCCIFARDH